MQKDDIWEETVKSVFHDSVRSKEELGRKILRKRQELQVETAASDPELAKQICLSSRMLAAFQSELEHRILPEPLPAPCFEGEFAEWWAYELEFDWDCATLFLILNRYDYDEAYDGGDLLGAIDEKFTLIELALELQAEENTDVKTTDSSED